MLKKAGQMLMYVCILFVSVCAYDDFHINRESNKEMIEQGKAQYQLLKERGSLPRYGDCWKRAVEHVNDGCRHLSEDTQSDIALHITNCFLEMSGHETYNCELDKKPNLRGICINSMSDRAFNVYTEFYTHTQNICWFLRGQIWHETISENTFKVGKQLEVSSKTQQQLLKTQQESLELQEKMLKHGKFLEAVLEDLYISVRAHQELLNVMSESLSRLQTWIVGEISWIDSIIFYISAILFILLLTSTKRTSESRLTLFLLVFLNFASERFLCVFVRYFYSEPNIDVFYIHIYNSVWYLRYCMVFLSVVVFAYKFYHHKDLTEQNNDLLRKLSKKNDNILEMLSNIKNKLNKSDVDFEIESESKNKSFIKEYRYSYENNLSNGSTPVLNNTNYFNKSDIKENLVKYSNILPAKHKFPLNEISNGRYNLRSRHGTPESNQSSQ
ncbi:unnamed protein product [Brassicogethes aeneus]|uniref:Uncharacterized protein n=1 Tax=Brassicogethes aeneus TaxID=1431903 RepID=A0A9P0FP78_BRAAE|nr:unnamed protein product [Brassicogethes aeneus]